MSHLPSHTTSERSLWHDLRDIFRGRQQDYTTLPVGRAIALLAIPMVLEMLMQSVFGVVDIYFVGQISPEAVAAVGMTDSLLVIVFAICIGLSMATTAVVARRIGEKDDASANRAALQALVLGFLITVPISLVGIFFAPDLLRLMGASATVIDVGSIYAAILFGTNAVIMLLFLINAIFRGAGDAVLAMRALWLANLLNIALDPILIFGLGPIPGFGVAGAAIATSLGRGLGVVYQVAMLLRGTSRIHLRLSDFGFDPVVLRRLLRVSGPGIMQYIVGTASWLAIFRILAAFGSDVLAGYTIAIRILVFALLPSWGMGNAAATLVGQNLGAQRPDRAERSVWAASFVNMGFLGLVSVGMILHAEFLVGLFTDDLAVIGYGVDCLRIVSYTYVFYAFGMVTVQAFNGAGDTTTPTWINFVCLWLLEIPLALLLAHTFGLGAQGVFIAIAGAQAMLAFVSTYLFRQGWWKERVV